LKTLFATVCLLIAISSTAFGQKDKRAAANLRGFDEKPIHFGFLLGFNTMDFRVYNSQIANAENNNTPIYADVIDLQPGINIGIVSNLRLMEYLDLRFLPGISFGQRDLNYITATGEPVDGTPLQIKSTFLEFPLLLKYSSARQQNFKPYLVGGINSRVDLAKSKKDKVVLKPLDVYLEVGVGIDMYLTYFRFSTEIKASHGFMNVHNPNGSGEPQDVIYNQAIDKLTSNIFNLTFYFE